VDPDSTYVRLPPYFDGMPAEPEPVRDISSARVLALLGDSVTPTTSRRGLDQARRSAGLYLQQQGVEPRDFNSYGARRGNHEVMMRGTFANIRLRNLLGRDLPGWSPSRRAATPTTSPMARTSGCRSTTPPCATSRRASTSWCSRARSTAPAPPRLGGQGHEAARCPRVIAQSFERIHRSNLIGMGVLPLQFPDGESAASLG